MSSTAEQFTRKMQEECSSCKHVRHLHGHTFTIHNASEAINVKREDGKCEVNDCTCLSFVHSESSVA